MDYDKKSFREKLELIEVPEEVDLVIDKAIKRAKNRHKNNFLKATGVLTAMFTLFVFLNKTSPVFAGYVSDTSQGVKNLISHFRDKGIDNAIENGYVQGTDKNKDDFSKSAEDKGLTVTIDQFAISGNEIVIGYTVKADSKYNDWEDISCDSFQMIDNKGRILVDNRDWNDIAKDLAKKNVNARDYAVYNSLYYMDVDKGSFKKSRVKKGIFQFSTDKTKIAEIPDSITIKFYDFYDNTIQPNMYKRMKFFDKLFHKAPKVINGDWILNIKVDDKFKNAKEINYIKDANVDENLSINIEYVNLYPTVANAKFLVPINMSVNDVYLEDDNGNKYKCGVRGSGQVENSNFCEKTSVFESPYFEKVSKLYLVIKGKEDNKEKDFKIALKKK
ncbi:DUF4179 domain-containing protein [Clostridium botulinum]|uniref:DUF4179 domain-containing protein n=1 Tax=Clostridium botulinum TaxID=1491 RepID=UPI00059D4712|nr:DUF4179 domain-containing protein [Clostridium botulinum]KIN79842.1 ecf-type sigma factor negative effector [Clostridium botulinum]